MMEMNGNDGSQHSIWRYGYAVDTSREKKMFLREAAKLEREEIMVINMKHGKC